MIPMPQQPPHDEAEARKRVVDTRTAVALKHPFLAQHLYQCTSVEYDPSANTAYTDGERIGMGDWVCSLPLEQRMFVLAHEVVHDILRHVQRAKLYKARQLGPDMQAFDEKRFNQAADYIVNAMVDELGCGTPPEGALRDPEITATALVDDVYRGLPATPDDEDEGEQPPGHGGFDEHRLDSPGGGDSGDDGDGDAADQPSPSPAATEQELDEEARRNMAAALNAAKQAGGLPSGLERALTGMLEPKRSWVDDLRDFVTRQAGRDETSWARPHRRRMVLPPHIPYPGTDGCTIDCVVLAVDVSGSITDAELAGFVTEVRALLEQVRPRETHLIAWDTSVTHHEIDSPEDLEQLDVRGGGGTMYQCVVERINELGLDPDVVVSFTDGMVMWPHADDVPWPHVTVHTMEHHPAPFGHNVYMDPMQYRRAA